MAAESLAIFRVGEPNLGFSGCSVPAFMSWSCTTFLKIVVEIMTLGLPQVCKLWFWASKVMFPVKRLASKILMAVNYCGPQLD